MCRRILEPRVKCAILTQGSALKKLKQEKQEVEERGEGAQAGASETPAPLQLSPPRAYFQVRLIEDGSKCGPDVGVVNITLRSNSSSLYD